jgi:hypothetical protein
MIKEVKEAYDAGKAHEREKIVKMLKKIDMDIFMGAETFIHCMFHEWLDANVALGEGEGK